MTTVKPIANSTPLVVAGLDRAVREVVSYAAQRAEELDGRLRVVHTYVVPQTTLIGTYADEVRLRFEAGGQAVLDEARQIIKSLESPIDAEYVLVHGHSAPTLLAESHHATELVLGQDDPTWESRFFEGQVCQRVVAAASCRVVVIPSQATTGRN